MKTRKGFYRALRKVAKEFAWKIENDTGKIRGETEGMQNFCPITAVYYIRTKERVSLGEFRIVGEKMGLTREECYRIADNADDNTRNKGYDKRTRKALERAIGL